MKAGPKYSSDKRPNKTIAIPPGFLPHIHYDTVQNFCTFWKEETGCEVMQRRERGRLIRFDFFGTGPKVEAAMRVVTKWIESAKTKSATSTSWAKTEAFDANKWYYDEINNMETERKQQFKKPRDAKEVLPYQVRVSISIFGDRY
jgi:hypothetical protein